MPPCHDLPHSNWPHNNCWHYKTNPCRTAHKYLPQTELVTITRTKTKDNHVLEGKLWLARRTILKQAARVRSLKGELTEKVLRGDVRGLVASLNSIIKSGKDKKKAALIPFLCDLAKATDMSDALTGHGSNGMKWHKASKKIFAYMKVKGKGGLIRFFRKTLASASDERIQAQWAEDKVRLEMGEHMSNYVAIGGIYGGLMKALEIVGPVPYELEEDESHLNGKVAFDSHRDTPVGTCGINSSNHQCNANHNHLPLGSTVGAYQRIIKFGVEEKRACYIRVVVVTPLHPLLPALPVVIHPTCLKFDCDWVLKSWERNYAFCRGALASSLGPVPQGSGSDGAPALFAAMKKRMNVKAGSGRFSVDAPGLVLTGKLVDVDGVKYVTDLHMQDPRHCFALLFGNFLDNSSRDAWIGKFPASISDYRATASLAETFGDSHGAIKRHLDRSDAQNKTAPSVLVALRTMQCMEKAVGGDYGPKQPFEGTLAYSRLLSRFLLIFFGQKQAVSERAKHAGFFVGMLRRMRWHIKKTAGLTLTANFIPWQTYEHSIYAAQVAVLKFKAQKEFHPHHPMHVEKSGSDKAEHTFSEMRGFGKVLNNQQDCNAMEARERLETLVTLFKYEAEDNGLNFEGESRATQRDLMIHLHENEGDADADPSQLCDEATLSANWIAGDDEAKVEAERLGMKPLVYEEWWDKPYLLEEEDLVEMEEADRADSSGDGGGGGGGGEEADDDASDDEGTEIGNAEGSDLAHLLTSVVAPPQRRTKTNPLVAVPEALGGGHVFKSTLINEFNSSNSKLSSDRISRIRASTSAIADVEAAQLAQAAAKAGGGSVAAGPGDQPGAAPAAGAASVAANADDPTTTTTATEAEGAEEAGAREELDAANEIRVGSDVAFAMLEGSVASPRYVVWIGRVSRVFKGKKQHRYPVVIDSSLPPEIFLVCEWYSATSDRLKFHFREVIDRMKYSLLHFIGLVRIDLVAASSGSSSSSSSSSNQRELYSITQEQRSALDEALKMTTPVKRGSDVTVGEKKRKQESKEQERKEDEERMQRPRTDFGGRKGGREGTRAGATGGGGGGDDDDDDGW